MRRYFTLIDPQTGKQKGRFAGKTPRQAASKIGTRVARANPNGGQDGWVKYYIRECTRHSKHRIFVYQVRRYLRANPVQIHLDVGLVEYKYSHRVKSDGITSASALRIRPYFNEPKPILDIAPELITYAPSINCQLVIEI